MNFFDRTPYDVVLDQWNRFLLALFPSSTCNHTELVLSWTCTRNLDRFKSSHVTPPILLRPWPPELEKLELDLAFLEKMSINSKKNKTKWNANLNGWGGAAVAGRFLLSVADSASKDEGREGVEVGQDHQRVHQFAQWPTVRTFGQPLQDKHLLHKFNSN